MSHYPGLILTVGMTHEPVIYSIRHAGAQYLAFVCTSESERSTLNAVFAEIQLLPSAWRKFVVVDDPQQIGRLCSEFYQAYRWLTEECGLRPDKIASDPTAGRKWMSAGATMVAAHLGVAMHYVDVRFVGGKPDPSSMRVVELGNAYDQTGFIEAEKARSAFNRYDFAAAAEIFSRIRPSLSVQADLYDGLAGLAAAFDRWDRFEHYEGSLKEDFEEALGRLRRHLNSVAIVHPQLTAFVERATTLAQTIGSLFTGPRPATGFVVDVFENARRRVTQSAFDDACGRLYRTLEALSQFHLEAAFGIITGKADYSRCSQEQQAAIQRICGHLPDKIDLATGFKVLKALNHPLGNSVVVGKDHSNKFVGLLNDRDHSILAHGFTPIGKDRVTKFLGQLEVLLSQTLGGEFATWREHLQVPTLPFLLA